MLLLTANWIIYTKTFAQDFNAQFIKECKAAFLKKRSMNRGTQNQ